MPHHPYVEWRARTSLCPALREADDVPPEFLLQGVWGQQRLLRNSLKTMEGQPIHVLHPGFRNHEAGPDFRGAIVQIGNEPPRIGDVEIDLRADGWRAHGHAGNPNFKNVVLHVIWEGNRPAVEKMPTMVLRGLLDAPLAELQSWLGQGSSKALPEDLQGKCCAPLRALSSQKLTELLWQAANVRLQGKAQQLGARARQAGWEQALWEGIFRALGYKQNVWPMQRLAELRSRWQPASADAASWQSRLLGISGLLPVELSRMGNNKYLQRIWDQWWREREQFSELILLRDCWRFNSLRPANHPQRRIALAAHWLASGDMISRLEKWFMEEIADEILADSLLKVLQVERDDFWSWHWTFRSARLAKAQPMLGAARVTDLAVNVILPWFWMRAVEGKNTALQNKAERRYLNWPAAEDNSVLRLARQRLLGGARANVLAGAAMQQGLLQVVRDFCEHSNAVCDQCTFPHLVRSFEK